MNIFAMVVIYICALAFSIYIWKGIGDMNERYDLGAARHMAKKKERS